MVALMIFMVGAHASNHAHDHHHHHHHHHHHSQHHDYQHSHNHHNGAGQLRHSPQRLHRTLQQAVQANKLPSVTTQQQQQQQPLPRFKRLTREQRQAALNAAFAAAAARQSTPIEGQDDNAARTSMTQASAQLHQSMLQSISSAPSQSMSPATSHTPSGAQRHGQPVSLMSDAPKHMLLSPSEWLISNMLATTPASNVLIIPDGNMRMNEKRMESESDAEAEAETEEVSLENGMRNSNKVARRKRRSDMQQEQQQRTNMAAQSIFVLHESKRPSTNAPMAIPPITVCNTQGDRRSDRDSDSDHTNAQPYLEQVTELFTTAESVPNSSALSSRQQQPPHSFLLVLTILTTLISMQL